MSTFRRFHAANQGSIEGYGGEGELSAGMRVCIRAATSNRTDRGLPVLSSRQQKSK
jgi:hypothetical protein